MSNKLIIGIHGAQGSGKTTLANRLATVYGGEVLALADPLKEACSALFPDGSDVAWWGSLADKAEAIRGRTNIGGTGREWLQRIGDCVRDRCPDYFAATLGARIRSAHSPVILVPDVRMQNEFTYDYGYPRVNIGLTRKQNTPWGHETDTLRLGMCDHVIDNSSTPPALTCAMAVAYVAARGLLAAQ